MRSLWISAIFCLLSLAYVLGEDMKTYCEKLQDHCSSPGVAKQCWEQCGGENPNQPGGGDNPPKKPATKPPPATKKPEGGDKPTTKKPQGGGKKGKCDKRSPCVSMEEANKKFYDRCAATNGALKESCYPHCRYDEDTATMKKAFMGGPCPLSQLRTYLSAAANNKDNTGCCADTGVMSQKKTGNCGCFCFPSGPVWPGKGEAAKYAPCVSVLTGIMQCHYYAEGADD